MEPSVRSSSFIGLAAVLLPATLTAQRQQSSTLHTGMRVRLVVVDTVSPAPGDLHYTYPTGTITEIQDHALVLRSDSTRLNAVAAGSTARVPVMHIGFGDEFIGRKRHTTMGAVAGVVVGGVTGYILGHRTVRSYKHVCTTVGTTDYCYDTLAEKKQVAVGVAAVPIGVLGGAGIGYAVRTDRWRKLDITSLKAQFAP
jgi:hypothetical protein